MFIEPHLGKNHSETNSHFGWIEIICGSMFSGKTEELIRRLNRATIANQKVEIFKPRIDTRYHKIEVVSHNKNAIRCTPVDFANDILLLANDCDVVGIDEAQFFDAEITNVCVSLANKGIRVIVAGLDMDFTGKPFNAMPELMAVAEYVTKVHAICIKCGSLASYSFRINDAKEKVMLGANNHYEARCRKCFLEGIQNQQKMVKSKSI
jgi:thymidine kinase